MNHPHMRIFCFPHAGGGTSQYHRWQAELSARFEVIPVKLPGREERIAESAYSSLPELLIPLTAEMESVLDVPMTFFGQSMGALIAFELAHSLRRQFGIGPVDVIVAACRAPQIPCPQPLIHHLPDQQFVTQLENRFGAIDQSLAQDAEFMELLLPTLRADMTLVETYKYCDEGPLDCPILALGGTQDPMIPIADVAAWREQTSQSFSQRTVAGDHFFVNKSRQTVLRIIRRRLEQSIDE